jgi:hypothetical protein
MIEFNEYTPRGGWIKYRKRQEIKERVKVAFLAFVLLLAYGIVGYIESGV